MTASVNRKTNILLILVILSLMIAVILAAGTYVAYADEDDIASGTCGANLEWSLSEDYVLTISGTGAMDNYSWYTDPPWKDYKGEIEQVVFPEGLETIGSYAFSECTALHCNLELPSSVTSIGEHAFYKCAGIKGDLTIPEGVTVIEDSTFYDCTGFKGTLTLPSTLTEIKEYAFRNCKNLKGDINLPEDLTLIGNSAFYGCSSLTGDLSIPSGITTINEYVFRECSSLDGTLTLSNSLTSVGYGAFRGCTSLSGTLVIPDSVKTIGESAFNGCSGFTGLVLGSGLTTIDDTAFRDCTGFTGELVFPSRVSKIGIGAFYNCSGFTGSLIIPSKVYSLGSSGSVGPFAYCSGFENIVLHSELAINYAYAFRECDDAAFYVVKGSDGETFVKANHKSSAVHYITDEDIPNFVPHEYDGWIIIEESTCVKKGSRQKACLNCESIFTEELPLSSDNHNYGDWEVSEPSCTYGGYRERRCSDCYHTEHENYPATGHKWNTTYTVDEQATCEYEGSESIRCSVCNTIKSGSSRSIAKKPHTYGDWYSYKEATCTEPGLNERQCEVCWHTETEDVPASGHKWNTVYSVDEQATCTQEGSESIHCSICDAVKDGSSRDIAKKPHVFGEWYTNREATCAQTGLKERECEVCWHTETEEIPTTNHKWNIRYTVDEEASCSSEGSKSIHCSVCDEIKEGSTRTVASYSHEYGKWIVVEKATCTETGLKEKECIECGHTLSEEIPAKGHKWNSEYTVDKKATYAKAGSKSIHCSVCNAVKSGSKVSIPKLKVNPTTLYKPTATKKGFTVKWKKGKNITGYQIQYALNKKFTEGKKSVLIKKKATTSKKITKLKAKKKYFVRIRTYKTVNGKKYYSSWSKPKTVTTKK